MSAERTGGRRRLAFLSAVLATAAAIDGGPTGVEAETPAVTVGLERLTTERLAGQRVGLVVHRASVTHDGRHAIDVVRGLGVDVVRLFTPEHGLRGQAAAGAAVADGLDPISGLPVVSLYGARRKPAPEDLHDLDVLVFDLQGAGVRFYTYVSTLILCLEAAAEAGIELLVLDRPNPLGGERIEGPVAAPRKLVPESFVNLAPGPLVHGLTLGEMARLVARDRRASGRASAAVEVVPMDGWRRTMTWDDTGRSWVPPSPNLRSADAALVYPGTALLEATNLSEGRGTETPFLRLGAPWLRPRALRRGLDDLALEGLGAKSIRFTPQPSPAAPNPKYNGRPCRGLRLAVTDPHTVSPYRLGIALLHALSRDPAFAWRDEGRALTWLLGTPRPLLRLRSGASVDDIVAADRASHEAWRRDRRDILLYR